MIHLYRRISVKPSWSGEDLVNILESGAEKPLRYVDTFDANHGWNALWGVSKVDNGYLTIKPDTNSSAGVFLDGSVLWDDYELLTGIESFKGDSLSLAFNFSSKLDFDVCEYTNRRVRIERKRNGVSTVLAEQKIELPINSGSPFEIGYVNKNNVISCYFDGDLILQYDIEDALNADGGIGYMVWAANGETELIADDISIKNLK